MAAAAALIVMVKDLLAALVDIKPKPPIRWPAMLREWGKEGGITA